MNEVIKAYEVEAGSERDPYSDLAGFLEDYGGIGWLATVFPESINLLGGNKARRAIFLEDKDKEPDRIKLLALLENWLQLLQQEQTVDGLVMHCLQQAEAQEQAVQKNLLGLFQVIKPLETGYRGLSLFFQNAERDQVNNLSLINCTAGQLGDLNASRYFEYISEELKANFDRVDLQHNYSLLVLPGYIGPNPVLEKWAKVAFENKVMIITDFEDLDEVDDVMEVFEASGLAGGDLYRSSMLVCCNWLVGRGRHAGINEAEDLMVPPSTALAGKMYSSLLSQVSAGKRFGVINGVEGVKFPLKKSEVACLERMNLVPMFSDYGRVMSFSAKTLFNGANLGLQIYSVVRVFDYVAKVLMDFLNRRAFENFNANIRKELMAQIVKFLDGISGNGKLIEDFSVKRFEQDAAQKDKIHLDIHLKPYFPAKNFMIKMDGKKGDEGNSWDTTYDQE